MAKTFPQICAECKVELPDGKVIGYGDAETEYIQAFGENLNQLKNLIPDSFYRDYGVSVICIRFGEITRRVFTRRCKGSYKRFVSIDGIKRIFMPPNPDGLTEEEFDASMLKFEREIVEYVYEELGLSLVFD